MASAIKVVVCECNKTAREEQQAVLGNFEEQIIGANVVETAFAKFGRELVSSRFPSPSVLFVSSWLLSAAPAHCWPIFIESCFSALTIENGHESPMCVCVV